MSVAVTKSWAIIHDILQDNCGVLFDALAKPATKLQIKSLEKRIGDLLPNDLIESLLIHNGMVDSYLVTIDFSTTKPCYRLKQ